MVNSPLHYAFVDESGTVACNADSHFLAIALVSTAQPRTIEVLVRTKIGCPASGHCSGHCQ